MSNCDLPWEASGHPGASLTDKICSVLLLIELILTSPVSTKPSYPLKGGEPVHDEKLSLILAFDSFPP